MKEGSTRNSYVCHNHHSRWLNVKFSNSNPKNCFTQSLNFTVFHGTPFIANSNVKFSASNCVWIFSKEIFLICHLGLTIALVLRERLGSAWGNPPFHNSWPESCWGNPRADQYRATRGQPRWKGAIGTS